MAQSTSEVVNAAFLASETAGWSEAGVRARSLEAIASALDSRRDDLLRVASDETALTVEELAPEFARMTGTLRMFASLASDGSWVRAAIDARRPDGAGAIGPNHDVRRMLTALRGVAVVFGASNFPLAYGVCGGDTASALAAGCPVVVKEHPAHPRTGRLIAATCRGAIHGEGHNPDLVGYVEDDGTDSAAIAKELVASSATAAVGFTGSLAVGTLLHQWCANRPGPLGPIPLFAEMGSVNPGVIFPAALASRSGEIIDQFAASIASRFGQQCTCPGIIYLHGQRDGRWFAEALGARLAEVPARRMLTASVAAGFERSVSVVAGAPGVSRIGRAKSGGPVVLHCTGLDALAQFESVLATEMFGPGVLVVDDAGFDGDTMEFPGSLTLSVWFDPDDLPAVQRFLKVGRFGAGRVVFNGVPTGVRVAASMVHGGPWPATNRPDTTAVGPLAIERWCRPVCYQNCPDALLPRELQDANPLGITRLVDGVMSSGPVTRRSS